MQFSNQPMNKVKMQSGHEEMAAAKGLAIDFYNHFFQASGLNTSHDIN